MYSFINILKILDPAIIILGVLMNIIFLIIHYLLNYLKNFYMSYGYKPFKFLYSRYVKNSKCISIRYIYNETLAMFILIFVWTFLDIITYTNIKDILNHILYINFIGLSFNLCMLVCLIFFVRWFFYRDLKNNILFNLNAMFRNSSKAYNCFKGIIGMNYKPFFRFFAYTGLYLTGLAIFGISDLNIFNIKFASCLINLLLSMGCIIINEYLREYCKFVMTLVHNS